ncbi:hypothetical protein [Streptomyces sp. NPDC058985]|uniref:hypothetical protein n=1 Tax=Streptomyces sp. NPDC058985 TaxID=3346684 RepID=UPI0036B0B4D2
MDAAGHARDDLVDPVIEWLTEPAAAGVLLLRGRPGSGKTTALRQVVRTVEDDPRLTLAYGSLRDHGAGLVSTASEDEVVKATAGFAAQGLPEQLGIAAGVRLDVDVRVENLHGSLDVATMGQVDVHGSGYTVGWLVTVLKERAAVLGRHPDLTLPVLVLVLDAVDELEWEAPEFHHRVVRELLSHAQTLRAAGVRLILSAQTLHESVSEAFPGDVLDIEAKADDEIRSYARARLGTSDDLSPADVDRLARAIAVRADGLFIVAAGYVDEILDGQVPDDLWAHTALPSAATYFRDALKRMWEPGRWISQSTALRVDTERILSVLAVTRSPMAYNQVSKLWRNEPPPDGSRRWAKAQASVLAGPVRRYLAVQRTDGAAVYRLFHPTVREAVLSGDASRESISVTSERARYLRALTPLFPAGTPWNGEAHRSVVQDTPLVLADLLEELIADDPSDPDVTEWLDRCRLLIESWEWMECCLVWHDPSDPVPLGFSAMRKGLVRLAAPASSLDLWPSGAGQGDAAVLPLPTGPLRAPARLRRPAADAADADRGAPRGGVGGRRPGHPDDRYAWIGHPLIKRVRWGANFPDRDAALAHLRALRETFEVSDVRAAEEPPDSLVLWVRNYRVSTDERRLGYQGHYMALTPRTRGTRTVVQAAKRPEPARQHPQRNHRRNKPHPNWGATRSLRGAVGNPSSSRPWIYASRAEAEAQLRWLRDAYPKATSALRKGRLGLLVWDPTRSPGPGPTRQTALHVEPVEGGFVLVATFDEQPATRAPAALVPAGGTPADAPRAEPADAPREEPVHGKEETP